MLNKYSKNMPLEVQTKSFNHTIMYVLTFILTMGSVWVLAADNHTLIRWWYAFLLSFLFATRIYSFYRKEYLFYLLELCYVVNFVSIITVPANYGMKYLYPFMHGPLAGYALVFGDALLPHDWDRTTSYSIHVLGAVFTRRLYWNGDQSQTYSLSDLTFNAFLQHMLILFGLYMLWAVPYTLFYLFPFNGKGHTMARYVNRMKDTDELSFETKIKYIRDHAFFVNLAIVFGIFSMYCWQFNYFVVFCEIMSGILNGAWLYYTGKRFNTRKFLVEAWCKTKEHVKVDSQKLSVDFKVKNGTHIEMKPFSLPKVIKTDSDTSEQKKDN